MAWYIILALGFLTGLAISNAYIRHYALTLVIWISKATCWIFDGIINSCEWLQDRFDDIDYVPEVKVKKSHKVEMPTSKAWDFGKMSDKQIHEKVAEKEMTNEEVIAYIQKNPDKVSIKRRGGE